MAETSRKGGLSTFSKVTLGLLLSLWTLVVVPLVVGVVTPLINLPKDWAANLTKFFNLAIQNPVPTVLIIFILVLLTYIFYLHSRSGSEATLVGEHPVQPSPQAPPQVAHVAPQPVPVTDLEASYLRRMVHKTERLSLTGIPAGLVAPSVPLDEVFIPSQFFPKRLPSDYPFTKDEYARYKHLLQEGRLSEEMERALMGTEKHWLEILKRGERVGIAELWDELTRENPAAVIQGYPGMGKSTLLARVTLHMARCGMRVPDPTMGKPLSAVACVPILLLLKDYATELRKAAPNALPLLDYLKLAIEDLRIPGLFDFLHKCLGQGRCLMMLDGLDEVSDLEERKLVKQEIERFILEFRDVGARDRRNRVEANFNRFLITSRVAGYDVVAFGDYLHFTVAELTPEQIVDFLPRWCRASVRREPTGGGQSEQEREEMIDREAGQMAQRLSAAVAAHPGVRHLAENPLLLTLLAVMQQNSIELPKQRVELYTVVTRTFLENRNLIKNIKPIPEAQAIQRLGPIAYTMQKSGNSFARQRDVKEALRDSIQQEEKGGTAEEVAQEVESFLSRIRERGGLFVIRTGDYFGFFHRTFQEYFAARYILNQIKQDAAWITTLVEHGRNPDDVWREPFLLAVAYQSGEDETVARKILTILLTPPQNATFGSWTHDLLLAAECLIEAKPLTIGAALEKQIAEWLLRAYEQTQRARNFEACSKIEEVLQRWLLNLSGEAFRPALLMVLSESITDSRQVARQQATLTLLSMIAQNLTACPALVFDMLIPPLLSLTGLPAVGKLQPAPGLSPSPNLNIADLALTALSFLGKRGPAGLLLSAVRQHFKDRPEQLCQLAYYSLQCGTLITPAVVPRTGDNFQRYSSAIAKWMELRDSYNVTRITAQNRADCLAIHEELLTCTEEVAYPITLHLLIMLQRAEDSPERWQQIWQSYLQEQLNSRQYISYQEVALLWAVLFPGRQAQEPLARCILSHYNGNTALAQKYAQRFIAAISEDLRDLSDLSDSRYLRYVRDVRNLRNLSDVRDARNVKDIRNLSDVSNVRYIRYVRDVRDVRDLRNLRELLLTREVAERAKITLSGIEPVQQVNLLGIIMGRMLHIEEAQEMGDAVERELQQLVDGIDAVLRTRPGDEVKEAALDALRYLPVRSANEVRYVRGLAEGTRDASAQEACAEALQRAKPKGADAWYAMEACKQSRVKAVRDAVERVLRGR